MDQIWAADLIEIRKFSKWNKRIKYLLMVIDIFSKFGWIESLKDKRGETVAKAFQTILNQIIFPVCYTRTKELNFTISM